MAPFWPVVLKHENLILRPLRYRDKRAWIKIRDNNQNWFGEWEATIPNENLMKAKQVFIKLLEI